MPRTFKILAAVVATLFTCWSTESALATTFSWGQTTDYYYAGDHFNLDNAAPDNRQNGTQLVNTHPESTTQVPSNRWLANGRVPYPWKGSTTLALTDSGNGDGIVTDNSGNTSVKLGYIDSWHALTNDRVANEVWWVQADVKPNTGVNSGDHVGLGMLKNTTFSAGTTMDNVGLLWAELTPAGTWELDAKIGLTGTAYETLASNTISNFNPNQFHTMSVDWNFGTNVATLKMDGNALGSYNLDNFQQDFGQSLGWGFTDIGQFGFELGGNAQLDNFAATPEPSSIVMLGIGGLGFWLTVLRNRRNRRNLLSVNELQQLTQSS